MVPDYGPAEVPQAFCRVAAVHGAIYVLRCPLKSVLLSKDGHLCTGVRLQTGQVGSAPQRTDLFALYNAHVLYHACNLQRCSRLPSRSGNQLTRDMSAKSCSMFADLAGNRSRSWRHSCTLVANLIALTICQAQRLGEYNLYRLRQD